MFRALVRSAFGQRLSALHCFTILVAFGQRCFMFLTACSSLHLGQMFVRPALLHVVRLAFAQRLSALHLASGCPLCIASRFSLHVLIGCPLCSWSAVVRLRVASHFRCAWSAVVRFAFAQRLSAVFIVISCQLFHTCLVRRDVVRSLWFVPGLRASPQLFAPSSQMESRRHKRLKGLAASASPGLAALQQLLHRGGITNAALAALLKKIKENPELVDNAKSSNIGDANLAVFFGLRHVHRLPMVGREEPFEWELYDPNRLVAYLIDSCPRLADAFADAARRFPCSASQPWHLCIGFDEFTPGNLLRPNNARKTMALNFSFMELGQERLWHDESWFTPVLVRHSVIAAAEGGWSAMLRAYLHLHLFSNTGIATAGLPLVLGGQPFLLFAKLSHVLADAEGHRAALEWKGAAGLKCCLRHWNVLKLNSDLAHRDVTFVEIDCSDPTRFKKTEQNDLFDQIDTLLAMKARVDAGIVPKSRLEKLQMACGFSCTPQGLLADRDLRPRLDLLPSIRYDWMHCALQDGTVTTEAALLLSACEGIGVTSREIETHLKSDWDFPQQHRAKGNLLWRVFDESRKTLQDKVKASASEMLILYVLLRHFFEYRVGGNVAVAAQLQSFCAACACIDIILKAKRQQLQMAEASTLLMTAIRHHLQCHAAAYGKNNLKPKFHWMWDVAELMANDPFVLDCFVIERLHRRAKRIGDNIQNTRSYERSILASVGHSHRNALQGEGAHVFGLPGRVAPLPGCQGVVVGNTLVQHGLHVSAGDLVFQGLSLGRVSSCCLENGILYVIVLELILVRQLTSHSSLWASPTGEGVLKVWAAADVELAVAWSKPGDAMTVLRV